jgi:polyhydroxyalkanoate synthase
MKSADRVPHRVLERVNLGAPQAFLRSVIRPEGHRGPSMERTTRVDAPAPSVPVLLVHGFGQNRRAWHLPSRSFANHLAAEGFDVFNIDLPGKGLAHTANPGTSWIAAATEHLPACLDAALGATESPYAFVLGHSQGGLAACALAGLAPSIRGVGALACPFALGRGNPVLRGLALALGAAGRATAQHTAFPMGLVRDLFRATPALWETPWLPLPLRAWRPGSFEPDVRDEWLHHAFDRSRLAEVSHLLDPLPGLEAWAARTDCALLTVAGTHDLLAPPHVVAVGFDASRARDKTALVVEHGHGDLLVGRQSPQTVWPQVVAWLRRLSGSRVA